MPLDQTDRAMIEKLEAKLAPLEERIAPIMAEIKRWHVAINMIYEAAGEEPRFVFEEEVPRSNGPLRPTYGRAEFFNKRLATVVTRILEDCNALDIDELYDLMFSGGFDFTGSTPDKAKNNLKISLGKNTKFARTPQGHYVLAGPGASRIRRNGATEGPSSGKDEAELDEGEDELVAQVTDEDADEEVAV